MKIVLLSIAKNGQMGIAWILIEIASQLNTIQSYCNTIEAMPYDSYSTPSYIFGYEQKLTLVFAFNAKICVCAVEFYLFRMPFEQYAHFEWNIPFRMDWFTM